MSETDETTDLRALDRDLADLMGWTPETFSDGVYWRDRAGVMWPYLPNFSGCKTLDPHVQWEGFGLLVEEAKRRGFILSVAFHTEWTSARVQALQEVVSRRSKRKTAAYRHYLAETPDRSAPARVMRDVLKAAQEAP